MGFCNRQLEIANDYTVSFFPDHSVILIPGMNSHSQTIVRPARSIRGNVQLPGDKSISHRYAMLAGIAEGPSRLENYSTGADCASTLGCMRTMGVNWEGKDGNVIEVQGRGWSLLRLARRSTAATPDRPCAC